jgi:hypothetical protein
MDEVICDEVAGKERVGKTLDECKEVAVRSQKTSLALNEPIVRIYIYIYIFFFFFFRVIGVILDGVGIDNRIY